jgi:hypothetical protein
MLIKLNRDNTSGGVMNALYMDIFDNLFSGFTMTATDLTFEVGDILKNTINEIIFSVYSPELYFYYTATNGGWQSLLTGISYFSYYMNRTLILNCPTYIAVAPMTIDLTSVEDGGYNLIGDTEPQTPTENTTNFIQNIINNPSFMYIFAIFGGLIVLMLVSTLLGRFK